MQRVETGGQNKSSSKQSSALSPLREKVSRRIDALCFFGLLFGLAVAPFWFGSDRPIAWDLNAIWYAAITLVYEGGRLIGRRNHAVSIRRIWFPALSMALVAVWTLIQMAPFLPAAHQQPIWQMARDALGLPVAGAISINPDETMAALLKLLTGACLFWTTLQLCRAPDRARQLVAWLAIVGAAYAAYGIVAFYAFPTTILWYPKVYYNDSVTSTFVNRNSYATYAGIGLIAALAMAFSGFVGGGRQGARDPWRRLAHVLANVAGSGGAWIAAALVISIAWVLSGSRGGIMATFAGLAAFIGLASFRGRKNAVGAGMALLLALVGLGVAAFSYGDYFAERVLHQGFASDDRLAAYRLTLLSIADAPLLGFGWGTFREVLPLYRDSSLDPFPFWDLAHNSYLELYQGLGVPAATLFLIGLGALVGRCAYASLTRRNSATAPLVATCVTLIVFLHAFVDFSLQMQAIALTWLALLAAGFAQSWSSRARTD